MLICPSCKTLNGDTAETCASCGKELGSVTRGFVVAGRYQILSLLGQGGMGMVYKAHDDTLDEIVAIKILRPEITATPEVAGRFRSEIRLARRVSHRNVCRIHEYGEYGGVRYISMEFIEGTDLRQLLRLRGYFPPEEAYDVAIQIAHGLQAIHEEGIIHRDLKTSNVMRDGRGVVKLMDFGIAKEWALEGVTGASGVLGTPGYMSPEQVLGKRIDFRSDIYSLGVVAYELFTGTAPFRGESPAAAMFRNLAGPPSFDEPEAQRIPEALKPVLQKALSRVPGERFLTARDMGEALVQGRTISLPKAASPGGNGPRATMTLPWVTPFARWRTDISWRLRRVWRRSPVWLPAPIVVAAVVGAYLAGRGSAPPATAPAGPPATLASVGPPPTRAPLEAAVRPQAPTRPAQATMPPRIKADWLRPTPAPTTMLAVASSPPVLPVPTATPPPPGPSMSDIALLVQDLRSGDWKVRNAASTSLGRLGVAAVPALAAALRDPVDVVRGEAAATLGRIGAAAKEAVPALGHVVRADVDGHVRSRAAAALGQIGGHALAAAPALVEALRKDPDERVRLAAVGVLPAIGIEPGLLAPVLAEALRDRSALVRQAAALALGALGPGGAEAVPALRQALKDENPDVRERVAEALKSVTATRD